MMYLQRASFIFKIKIVLQIVIAMNVCFLNAILAAGQGNGFDILMNSMALMTLNDIDDIIAQLYSIISGINFGCEEVTIHTDRDYLFSRAFAIPHLIWVAFYSLCMLGAIQIENTPAFITMALFVQTYGITFLILVWYIVCYASFCQDTGK